MRRSDDNTRHPGTRNTRDILQPSLGDSGTLYIGTNAFGVDTNRQATARKTTGRIAASDMKATAMRFFERTPSKKGQERDRATIGARKERRTRG